MTINKITPLTLTGKDASTTHTGDGANYTYVAYGQRAGESGLTQEIHLLLNGWEGPEADELVAFVNAAISMRLRDRFSADFG